MQTDTLKLANIQHSLSQIVLSHTHTYPDPKEAAPIEVIPK